MEIWNASNERRLIGHTSRGPPDNVSPLPLSIGASKSRSLAGCAFRSMGALESNPSGREQAKRRFSSNTPLFGCSAQPKPETQLQLQPQLERTDDGRATLAGPEVRRAARLGGQNIQLEARPKSSERRRRR